MRACALVLAMELSKVSPQYVNMRACAWVLALSNVSPQCVNMRACALVLVFLHCLTFLRSM